MAPLLEKVTGLNFNPDDLMKLGEKISNINRMYNIKNGRTRKEDTLPPRFFKEKHMAGLFEGKYLTEEIFHQWLDLYYQVRGWDKYGVPTDRKLAELNIQKM
jgi:aldehyde:ferredoxin oxidoreductase